MISAGRLRPALIGWAATAVLLAGGMALVRTFGTASSGRTYVIFLVNVMLVVALQAFIGNSGIVSFGHVAFMGIGAYTTALVSIPSTVKLAQLPELPAFLANTDQGLLVSVTLSALVALAVAAIFGGAIIRMTGSTMAMATLALLIVVHTFFQNATTYTRGSLGLAGIPVRTTLVVATVAAVLFVLIGRLYKDSGAGLRVRAAREDPLSAASVGASVARTRFGAWLLSAAMMGAAGSLWAQSVIAFNANQFYFAITFALLAMLVIGGRTSITGAVAGAAIITFLTDSLARVEQGVAIGPWELPRITGSVQFVIALLIIVTLILRPEGIFDRWELDDLARRLRRARDKPTAEDTDGEPPRITSSAGVADDEAPAVLQVDHVAKRFEGVAALDGVDLNVRRGEILGLIGPNGSGKTTLLNVVSGIYAPTEGEVAFEGR
ncbi:branched-chain amino acid ABC transporter permease [soil metagenome]